MTVAFIFAALVLFVGLALAYKDHWFAYAIAGFYALPLYLLTALSSTGYAPDDFRISPSIANLVRVGLHGAFFFILALVVLLKCRGRLRLTAVAVPAVASCMWMIVIVVLVDGSVDTAARALLSLLATVSLFILVPSVTASSDEFLVHIGRATVALALVMTVLSAMTILRYGNFPDWTMRFGRPLNPNVLAYLLLLAFAASGWSRVSIALRFILGTALIATGSRACTGLFVLFCVIHVWRAQGTWKSIGIALPIGALALLGMNYVSALLNPVDVDLYNRSTLGSGRFEAWANAASEIRENPWFGSGERFYVEDAGSQDREMRTHNLYVEMSASYGIPMAALSLMLYAALWIGSVRVAGRLEVPLAARRWFVFYAFAMLVMPLVSTVSWMNLGDGAVILSLSTIIPLLARRRCREVSSESVVWQSGVGRVEGAY